MRKLLLVLSLVFAVIGAGPVAAADRWIGSWGAGLFADPERSDIAGTTVRTYIRLTAGGGKVRLRFSNAFGTQPLQLDSVTVSKAPRPGADLVDPSTMQRVRFGGSDEIVVPQGADYLSDPIPFEVPTGAVIAVTYRFASSPGPLSVNVYPKQLSWLTRDTNTAGPALQNAKPLGRLLALSGVDVLAGDDGRTIAIIGDSITSAGGASVDGRGRWTDILASRIQATKRGKSAGLINLGINSGRAAKDGTGPAASARLERDALSRPGLDTILVFIGVNDIGKLSREAPVTPENRASVVAGILQSYRQMIARAHDRGIRVVGMTILPFGGTTTYRSDAAADEDRRAVNEWIRSSGEFDGVIDLDPAMRNSENPSQLSPQYDRGDKLHPSAFGQEAIGNLIPLNQILRPAK